MTKKRTGLLLTLHLLILASLGGCEAATKGGGSLDTRQPRIIHMPSPQRPIAMIGRGKPGKYDLVFGGKDGTSRTWLKTGDSAVGVGMSRNFRVAAVLYRAASGNGGRLTFYDVDGNPVGSADLPLPRGHDAPRVWVGERKEAVVVVTVMSPAAGLPAHALPQRWRPRPRPDVTTYYAAADGTVSVLESASGKLRYYPTDVAFAKSPGFAIICPVDPATQQGSKRRWRLTRFVEPGKIAWRKDILQFLPRFYTTKKGADLSLLIGRPFVHFHPDGTFKIEEPVFDPVVWNKANPGYKERTGKSYEQTCLPGAVDELAKTASLTKQEKAAARKILRTFIYDYLESFVTGGGKAVERDQDRRLAKVDKSFREALSDEKFTKYLKWRKRPLSHNTNAVQARLLKTADWKVDVAKLVVSVD